MVERAQELRPLGVGINLLPHAVRELTELGLGDAVAAIGVPPGRLTYVNRLGQLIWSEPRGTEAGYHWPQLSVHRGEFQLLLADEVRRRLGPDAIRLGWRATAVEHGGSTDTVRFADASGAELALEADVVVGADGIHSALRAQAYPDEGAPPWNRLVLWRGTALAPTFLDGRTMIMAGDGEQKFVAYPLVAPGAEQGMTRVNFIAERRAPDGMAETADWNHPVDAAPIVELFADWRFDWLDVPGVIAAADGILEYPMVDRDPLPRWTFGRTTLLGDAAHALYPNGSNGASQAILDARSLAFRLATVPQRRGRARGVRGGPASRHDAPVGHDPAARAGAGHAARPRSGAGRVRGHPRRDPRAGARARSPTRTSWPPGSTPNGSTSGRRSPRRGDRERAGRIDSTSAGSAGSSRRCAAACCVPPARPSTCPTSPMPRSRCSAPCRSEPCAARPRSPKS